MPARKGRGVREVALLAAVVTFLVPACSLGGGDDEEPQSADGQDQTTETGPDVAALRADWAEEIGAACTERNEQIEALAQGLPGVVEQEGLAAAAAQFDPINQAMLDRISAAELAPGDEERAQELADKYQEAVQAETQALGAPYAKQDRGFYVLMRQSEDAREQANAISTELGAESCAAEASGPYSTVDGLAALRWGARASKVCRERDRAYMRLRPTDATRFEAVTRRWLRQTRALRPPEAYADRIERFLDLYVASTRAQKDAAAAFRRGDIAAGERLTDKGNRLSAKSSDVMYGVGFEIGFERFCSARPA